MSKTPKNHGQPWNPSDDARPRQLARENTPTGVMGIKLGGTEASGRAQAHGANVSRKQTN